MVHRFTYGLPDKVPQDKGCGLQLTWLISSPNNGLTTVLRRIRGLRRDHSYGSGLDRDGGAHKVAQVIYIAAPPVPTPERIAIHLLAATGAPIVGSSKRALVRQAMHVLSLTNTETVIVDDFDPTVGTAASLIAGLVGLFHPGPHDVRAQEYVAAWNQASVDLPPGVRAERLGWGIQLYPPRQRALVLGVKQETWNKLALDRKAACWLAAGEAVNADGAIMTRGVIGDHVLLAALATGAISTAAMNPFVNVERDSAASTVNQKHQPPQLALPCLASRTRVRDGTSMPVFGTSIRCLSLPRWRAGIDATRFLATAWKIISMESAVGNVHATNDALNGGVLPVPPKSRQVRPVAAELTDVICKLADGRLGEMLDLLRHVQRYAERLRVGRRAGLSLALVADALASEPWVGPTVRETV